MIELSELRRSVIGELVAAGFTLEAGLLVPPDGDDPKAVARALHASQRTRVLAAASEFVHKWEDILLPHFANGSEINPERIEPLVIPVVTEEEAALFRFASLHWAIPVSQGYGRRVRFLVRDGANGRLIGIFALGDPVFNLTARDQTIDWTVHDRRERLYNVFDAFVLGAVDPYRQLIAGKLIALCAVSDEVVDFLETRYKGAQTVIQGREKLSRPVLITTSSALGRSSIYNRVTFNERKVYRSCGYTEGFGHFQFSDELFEDLVALVSEDEDFRGNAYGQGPNWKMRTIRSALERLGLSGDLLRHGIRREVFLAPLSSTWRAFLRGETDVVRPFGYPLGDLGRYFCERWAVARAMRRPAFREWSRERMRLSSLVPPPTSPTLPI